MAGTKEGGLKAAETNKLRHGADFYKNLGKKGNSSTKGFASNPEFARIASAKGVLARRKKAEKENE